LTEPGCFCKIKIFGKTTKHHKDYTGTIFVQFKLDLRNKVYTLNSSLVFFGRWLSSGTPASSTAKTGCHEIAEILLKVALSTNKSTMGPIAYTSSKFSLYKEEFEDTKGVIRIR
jgi:hypothetical protein